MEFYAILVFTSSNPSARFNSQRDGILPSISAFSFCILCKFQFPTGWNSTLTYSCMSLPQTVSIPNGMEFYVILQKLSLSVNLFQFPTGWNSTRSLWCWGLRRGRFQFPTGWNSTVAANSGNIGKKRFQFPTGWNSTDQRLLFCIL